MQEEVQKAVEVLRAGGILLYPTDTVWGIGCDATNETAVEKIYGVKKRNDRNLLILIDQDAKLNRYVKEVPDVAWDLVELTEDPLTIIYPGAYNLAKNLIAADGSVGIRVTKDQFCIELLRKFGKPIVSTSANISGEPTPPCYAAISDEIRKSVDHIVNLRQHEKSSASPSSIIKLGLHGQISIIRK